MKQHVLFAALGLVAFGAAAQEVGNVISSVPVVQQVAVPRQNCVQGMVQAQPYTSGMGGLAGGIAGAAIGSAIGSGTGTAAAMVLGTIGGAILGNNVEADNMRAQQAMVPTCTTETFYENRTVGYDVTYEYAGRQYAVRMPHDPGSTVRLQVTPMVQGALGSPEIGGTVGAPPLQAAPAQVAPVQVAPAPMVMAAPMVVAPYATYPAYPAYPPPVYYRPWYPPISLSLGFGFRGGHRHHHGGGHRRWR
jgi:uncharacterized protein YcfJ